MAVCASARKDGCLVEVLGCGSSHGMGYHLFQLSGVIKHGLTMEFIFRGSALKLHQSPHPRGPE
jgi:hypothetical protein